MQKNEKLRIAIAAVIDDRLFSNSEKVEVLQMLFSALSVCEMMDDECDVV